MRTSNWTKWILAAGCLALAPLQMACDPLECGPGTTDVDGECVPADGEVTEDACGPNAELVDGKCQGTGGQLTCGGQTAAVEDPDNPGNTICVAEDSCDFNLVCPDPTGAGFSLCGRLFDMNNNDMPPAMMFDPSQGYILKSDKTDTARCEAGDTTEPCGLVVQLYSLTNELLASEPTYLDHCGRFRFDNVTPVQQFPFGGVMVMNPGGEMVPSMMARPPVVTGNFLPTTSSALGGAGAYGIRKATYDAWATAAPTLDIDTKGAVMLAFLDKFMPQTYSNPAGGTVVMQFEPDALGNLQQDMGMPINFEPYGPGGTPGTEEVVYFNMGAPDPAAMATTNDFRVLLTNHTSSTIAPATYTNLWAGQADMSPATVDCNMNMSGFGMFMPFPAPTFAQQGAISFFPIPTINPDAAPNLEFCQ